MIPTIMPSPVTQLLIDAGRGNREAMDRLVPLVYRELHALAHRCLRSAPGDNSLQTTALIHEAYLKLVGSEAGYRDRVHFFALAARAMRMILVDSVRASLRIKRGGGAGVVTLDEAAAAIQAPGETLLALDQVLTRLSTFDPRKAHIVELHYFGGLSYDEIAAETGVSAATVHRELRLAKIWLANELRAPGEVGS